MGTGDRRNPPIELLEKQLRERTQEAERYRTIARELSEMLTVLNSDRPLDKVLDHIVMHASHVLGADAVAVYRLHAEEKVLRVQAAKGLDTTYILEMEIPVGGLALGRAIVNREPVAVPDMSGMLEQPAEEMLTKKQQMLLARLLEHYQAILAVPLIIKDEVYGGVTFYFAKPREFAANEIALAVAFCDHTALAIENARLQDQIKQRAEVAEGLRDILTILNSNRPLDEILEYICTQAGRLAGTDAIGIYRFYEDEDVLRIQASKGIHMDYALERKVPASEGIVGQAVLKRQPLIAPDMVRVFKESIEKTKDRRQRTVAEHFLKHYKALLAMPLVVGGEAYGAIALFYPETREFSDEEIAMATAFSNQAALAIENARLRSETERAAISAERNRLARELHDAVTQTLFSSSLIAEVLPRLWEQNPDEGRRRLQELRILTRGALAEMRALLLELRPKALADAEMGDLLNQLAEATTSSAQIPVTLDVEGTCSLPVDVKVALYRIAQEAMNNVAKHSGAKKAEIVLHCEANGVHLEITDDGRGFTVGKASVESLGHNIMKERAETVGAKLKIESARGKGTRISVSWRANEKKE